MSQALTIRRVQQKEAHCGPATIEMLFSFYGISVSQEALVAAVGMTDIIRLAPGMRLDELANAIDALYPDGAYRLLASYNTTTADLARWTAEFKHPVGVEWQGRFDYGDGRLIDQGHYSVVAGVNRAQNLLKIVDPDYHNTLTPNGEIPIPVFESRWWEVDTVPLPFNGAVRKVLWTEHLLFVLARQQDQQRFLDEGLQPVSLSLMWEASTEPVEWQTHP